MTAEENRRKARLGMMRMRRRLRYEQFVEALEKAVKFDALDDCEIRQLAKGLVDAGYAIRKRKPHPFGKAATSDPWGKR